MFCCIGELAKFVMNLKFDHVYVDVGNVNNLMKTGGKPVSSSLSSLSALSMLGSSSNALFHLCFVLASCVTSFFQNSHNKMFGVSLFSMSKTSALTTKDSWSWFE